MATELKVGDKAPEFSLPDQDGKKVTLKDLKTGRVSELKEHGDTKFEFMESEKVDLSHSYSDGLEEVFYDKEGGEFRCPAEAAKDALIWGSDSYVGFLVNGQLISISPPASVIVEVKETAPPIRGGGNSVGTPSTRSW